ncbi:hypothetical protein [Teichococcus aestuarii]|uniref:hypothetical protein n=1 Tax=Teichococcus aestuarii TaxID=568898 RepID=UPI00361BB58B
MQRLGQGVAVLRLLGALVAAEIAHGAIGAALGREAADAVQPLEQHQEGRHVGINDGEDLGFEGERLDLEDAAVVGLVPQALQQQDGERRLLGQLHDRLVGVEARMQAADAGHGQTSDAVAGRAAMLRESAVLHDREWKITAARGSLRRGCGGLLSRCGCGLMRHLPEFRRRGAPACIRGASFSCGVLAGSAGSGVARGTSRR